MAARSGCSVPTASTLNFRAGITIANAAVVRLGVNDRVCIFTSAPSHFIVDVLGYYESGSDYVGLDPARLFDSRAGKATSDGVAG